MIKFDDYLIKTLTKKIRSNTKETCHIYVLKD